MPLGKKGPVSEVTVREYPRTMRLSARLWGELRGYCDETGLTVDGALRELLSAGRPWALISVAMQAGDLAEDPALHREAHEAFGAHLKGTFDALSLVSRIRQARAARRDAVMSTDLVELRARVARVRTKRAPAQPCKKASKKKARA